MKDNSTLQEEVQKAIRWEPFMHAAEIGVTVKDGVVTLSGTVDSYSKKINIERAAKNVAGVKAVAEDITIDYGKALTCQPGDILAYSRDSLEGVLSNG